MAQTVRVPDDLYARLQRAAAAAHSPVDDVAQRALEAGLPPSADDAPPPHREALRQLEALSDDELWSVLRVDIAPPVARRHVALLERNAARTLSQTQRGELTRLREDADRRMLLRAHAAALLRWRGYSVPMVG